jgi:hypothetical protein
MAKKPPSVKTADNQYGAIFWGPPGPESMDDGRDLTIATKSNHSMTFCESGNSVYITPKCNTEYVGHNIDRTKEPKETPAKQILAENGDIVFIAENGNIKLKARNIYIETTGADPAGNFLVSSNGYITLAAGEQTRIAGSKVCIRGDGGVDIGSASYIMFRGAFKYGDYPSITGTIKALLAGNWAKLLDGIDQSCK